MGLPTRYAGDWARLQAVMRVDKKARGASLRFVVLDGLGNPTILTDPDQAWLDAAWAAVLVATRPTTPKEHRMTIQVLNGANLGRLGTREPEKYGTTTYAELVELIEDDRRASSGWRSRSARPTTRARCCAGSTRPPTPATPCVINPGGWSHTSVVLRDALAGLNAPLVEVHITNIHAREEFRHHSYVSGRGRRRHRRPRAWRATCWRCGGWRSRASGEPRRASGGTRCGPPRRAAGWTPSWSPTCSTSAT